MEKKRVTGSCHKSNLTGEKETEGERRGGMKDVTRRNENRYN